MTSPSEFESGGATHFFHLGISVGKLGFWWRWACETTLRAYVQESQAWLIAHQLFEQEQCTDPCIVEHFLYLVVCLEAAIQSLPAMDPVAALEALSDATMMLQLCSNVEFNGCFLCGHLVATIVSQLVAVKFSDGANARTAKSFGRAVIAMEVLKTEFHGDSAGPRHSRRSSSVPARPVVSLDQPLVALLVLGRTPGRRTVAIQPPLFWNNDAQIVPYIEHVPGDDQISDDVGGYFDAWIATFRLPTDSLLASALYSAAKAWTRPAVQWWNVFFYVFWCVVHCNPWILLVVLLVIVVGLLAQPRLLVQVPLQILGWLSRWCIYAAEEIVSATGRQIEDALAMPDVLVDMFDDKSLWFASCRRPVSSPSEILPAGHPDSLRVHKSTGSSGFGCAPIIAALMGWSSQRPNCWCLHRLFL